jgi:hypothetical protein
MSSNIITGKCAAAFYAATGQLIYILFDRTYRKKDDPPPGHWTCLAIGTYEQVMERIFQYAVSCEEGMLQSSGPIKPENFINAWRRELSEPYEIDDFSIKFAVGSSYSMVNEQNVQKVIQVLMRHNRIDLVKELESGSTVLELFANAEILVDLCGINGCISPYHCVSFGYIRNQRQKITPQKSAKQKILSPKYHIYRLDEKKLLVKFEDEPWRNMGLTYAAVSLFLMKIAYFKEMLSPGCSIPMITAFREACENASLVPGNTLVTIKSHVEQPEHRWRNSQAKSLVEHIVGKMGSENLPAQAHCFYHQIAFSPVANNLFHLSFDQVTWEVPESIVVASNKSSKHALTILQPALF